MDDSSLNRLRVLILRHCLKEAIQVGELLERDGMRDFNRQVVINMVHACALAGLLDHWGATSGTTYRTSRVGWVVLTVIERDR